MQKARRPTCPRKQAQNCATSVLKILFSPSWIFIFFLLEGAESLKVTMLASPLGCWQGEKYRVSIASHVQYASAVSAGVENEKQCANLSRLSFLPL